METFKYERRYKENTGYTDWNPVSETRVAEMIADYYAHNGDIVPGFDALKRGEVLQTDFAEYRAVKV